MKEEFNHDWKFKKQLTTDTAFPETDVISGAVNLDGWEEVVIPHTWNNTDGADGWSDNPEGGEQYYRGRGWYVKNYIFNSDVYKNKKIFIEFLGANQVADLYVNNTHMGTHKGGYSAFRFDITDAVVLDGNNTISVKVNNANDPDIAPLEGDFTKMGGIYRDCNIIAVNKTHIDLGDFGSSGIYLTQSNVTGSPGTETASADLDIIVKLVNDADENKDLDIIINICKADDTLKQTLTVSKTLSAGEKADIVFPKANLTELHLWNGTDDPYLYKIVAEIRNNDVLLDTATEFIGFRCFNVTKTGGFFLNGLYYDLKGVNYHQDTESVGWAMTGEMVENDYKIMLDMGVNAVRMAHYQHGKNEYETADRLGMIVWTEIGIVNKMIMNGETTLSAGFLDNAKQQLTEMIKQNYNRCSVAFWGISNELNNKPDDIIAPYSELSSLAKQLDGTRYVVYADNMFYGVYLSGLPGADLIARNKYNGWYGNTGAENLYSFGTWYDNNNAGSDLPIGMSEFGAGGSVYHHAANVKYEDITIFSTDANVHPEEWQSVVHEGLWAQMQTRTQMWCKFIWCMFDFASDGRYEGDRNGINDKGLVTRDRMHKKDAYYFYKSVWNRENTVWIGSKNYALPAGSGKGYREAKPSDIKVYSNAEKVELFLNDVSLGMIMKNNLSKGYETVFVWKKADLIRGENKAVATAVFADGTTQTDSIVWKTE